MTEPSDALTRYKNIIEVLDRLDEMGVPEWALAPVAHYAEELWEAVRD